MRQPQESKKHERDTLKTVEGNFSLEKTKPRVTAISKHSVAPLPRRNGPSLRFPRKKPVVRHGHLRDTDFG